MARTINYGATVDQFFGELVAGRIQGVRPQAALAIDVFRLYQEWAVATDLPSTTSAAWLCRYIGSRHGVLQARKRYAAGAFVEGPHSVLFLAGALRSRYGMEVELLGRQIAEFRNQVNHYADRVQEQADRVQERVQ